MITNSKTMDIQTVLIIILVGLAAGVLSGLVGVGGGIIIVPSLVYFIGFSQKTAQGTSLALILLPVGILAVLQYYKQGHVDIRIVGLLAIGFIVGGFLGSKFALSLPQDTVKKIFAVMLIIVALKMLFLDKPKKTEEAANLQQSTNTGPVLNSSDNKEGN